VKTYSHPKLTSPDQRDRVFWKSCFTASVVDILDDIR